MNDSYLAHFFSKFADDELVADLLYLYMYVMAYFAIRYLLDHVRVNYSASYSSFPTQTPAPSYDPQTLKG